MSENQNARASVSPYKDPYVERVTAGNNPFVLEARPLVIKEGDRLIPAVQIFCGGDKRLEIRDGNDDPQYIPKTEEAALHAATHMAHNCLRRINELLGVALVQGI